MHTHGDQRGAALIILLVILVLGMATLLAGARNSVARQIERSRNSAEALAQAREALIGYALTYGDSHSGEVAGYLLCPDLDGGNPEGSAEAVCGSKNVSVLGRFPWRTLNLPLLRDSNGECLWYAVSGSYKNNPKTDSMNWDSYGLFEVLGSNGAQLAGADAASRAVAVIFAPGPALAGQSRAPAGSAAMCGGDYTASNYLDGDGTHDNAMVPILANATATVVSGMSAKINDQIIYITKDDIFQAVLRRADFAARIGALLDDTYFQTAAISGTKGTDSINCALLVSAAQLFCKNWKEMLLFTRLPAPAPVIVDGVSTVVCSRVLIFGGQQTAAQSRLSAADRANPANYLEGGNQTAFAAPSANGSNFSGASAFNADAPSADVLKCLP